jgi:hypothetical protein
MSTSPEITTIATINEIAGRIARGAPVTRTLLRRLPAGVQVHVDVKVTTADGEIVPCTLAISREGVTCRRVEPGEPLDIPVH